MNINKTTAVRFLCAREVRGRTLTVASVPVANRDGLRPVEDVIADAMKSVKCVPEGFIADTMRRTGCARRTVVSAFNRAMEARVEAIVDRRREQYVRSGVRTRA